MFGLWFEWGLRRYRIALAVVLTPYWIGLLFTLTWERRSSMWIVTYRVGFCATLCVFILNRIAFRFNTQNYPVLCGHWLVPVQRLSVSAFRWRKRTRTTWPETHRPRAIIKPRDEASVDTTLVGVALSYGVFSHMTSRRPCWCSKTMKRRPCWCTKKILWEFNSFLM